MRRLARMPTSIQNERHQQPPATNRPVLQPQPHATQATPLHRHCTTRCAHEQVLPRETTIGGAAQRERLVVRHGSSEAGCRLLPQHAFPHCSEHMFVVARGPNCGGLLLPAPQSTRTRFPNVDRRQDREQFHRWPHPRHPPKSASLAAPLF